MRTPWIRKLSSTDLVEREESGDSFSTLRVITIGTGNFRTWVANSVDLIRLNTYYEVFGL
jgi:hypothetical protein